MPQTVRAAGSSQGVRKTSWPRLSNLESEPATELVHRTVVTPVQLPPGATWVGRRRALGGRRIASWPQSMVAEDALDRPWLAGIGSTGLGAIMRLSRAGETAPRPSTRGATLAMIARPLRRRSSRYGTQGRDRIGPGPDRRHRHLSQRSPDRNLVGRANPVLAEQLGALSAGPQRHARCRPMAGMASCTKRPLASGNRPSRKDSTA